MQPLAERMRPQSLDEYVGQAHLVGPGAVLRRAVETGRLPSFILWGPPGVGKTTLAKIIASQLAVPFYLLSAINSGVKDVRDTIDKAKRSQFFDRASPILFIDEIHRFSKSQQDSLLGAVEAGTVTLIGATTENPSFEVIPALLSRCQVYVLEPLGAEDLRSMVERALTQDAVLSKRAVEVQEDTALLRYSGGDGRRLYNLLELVTNNADPAEAITITDELVSTRVQENLTRYDKTGEQHYDIASAMIKSIRGSDPNGAVYWLARMIDGGEDVKFICRRLIISASEDIGLANPNALLLATTAAQAAQLVGYPEARIILSQAVIYLATSPKSNSSYLAINEAQAAVRNTGTLPVPLHLRNAPTKLMKQLDYGKNYDYSHDNPGNFRAQEYLPDALSGTAFFQPKPDNPQEKALLERLKAWWRGKYYP
ncbi:replication-associated recombination protein A [Neolewinella lacunae]|uniref:Replication-associated recombination protein A n=1 Tax=Neolewinella lacunae TaxID=1517758 RepID=A0A923PII0_9BACT|nr:replication-associated recombination protein A [Neolewinella lacunae]MBC6993914.1 replication-associated recombination protein A [Neolewinella lacunae]MDN3635004.1 replication-associated recombination protein A [Neolewinella lacunae]